MDAGEIVYGVYWVKSKFTYSADSVVSGLLKTAARNAVPLESITDAKGADVILRVDFTNRQGGCCGCIG